ncbi:MAG: pyridoxal-phosphate dependent enzyme [Tepidisphaerales bacterium]
MPGVSGPATSVLELIGNTPLVRLGRFDTGPCTLYVKLESQNPGGSIKDRIGRSMVEAAERDGRLRPGGTIVEATAGNTGVALALVAALKGYRCVLVVPDKMSREKVMLLRAMGAQVVTTRSDVAKGHPDYYHEVAERIAAQTPGAVYINQFANPANPQAHFETTGPEILRQTCGQVDAVVCGVGSGGTITGLARYFRQAKPDVELVLADPVGSILADYVETGRYGQAGSWLVEGIGEDFIPPIADLSPVKRAYRISDREAMATARQLLRDEGILAGSSSGTLVAAAVRYCREQSSPKTVVTFVCDSGAKYLSKVHNDQWLAEMGMVAVRQYGDLRDLISHRAEDGSVVSLGPDDTLATAFNRMRMYDISQLPVLDGGHLVGIVDESDLLLATRDDPAAFRTPVRSVMTTKVRSLPPSADVRDVLDVLDAGLVAVIAEGDVFHGLITRMDVLNHLRRKLT